MGEKVANFADSIAAATAKEYTETVAQANLHRIMCKICLNEMAEYVFIDCYHLVACEGCVG